MNKSPRSQQVYAERLLSIIDPQRKWIKHRVFRDSCVVHEHNYLKVHLLYLFI